MTDYPHADPDDPMTRWGSREIAEYLDQRRKAPPMTYSEAMDALANAAYAAVRAADNEDGAPVEALRNLAAEIDSLAVHGMTRAEADDARRLYEGAKLAGWVG